jgi:putative transposase
MTADRRGVPAKLVAQWRNVNEATVRRWCYAGTLEHWYESASGGGRQLMIAVSALTPEEQVLAIEAQAKCREGTNVRGYEGTSGPAGEDVGPAGAAVAGRGPAAAAGAGALAERDGRDVRTGLTIAESREAARDRDRQIEAHRLAVLDALETYCQAHLNGRNRTQVILEFLQFWNAAHADRPVARATLYEWMRRKREEGHLLPAYVHGPRGHSIPPEIEELFRAVYLTPKRLSVPVCRQLVIGQLTLAKSPLLDQVPSTSTFHQLVRSMPLPARILAREGQDAYRRRCEPTMERDYTQIAVMQCWVADHYTFKQFVLSEGRPIRPVKTEWMDMRSRRRVGWCIEATPSQETVLASLAMGVQRYGIPAECYTDNGREFSATTIAGKSRRFRVRLDEARVRALTEHLGILWHFSIPQRPEGRGMIERAFGVDLDRFDRLGPGFTGRHTEDKPEGLAEALRTPTLLPTLQEFREQYARYVEQVANEMPHEGHGMDGRSPREVFEAEAYVKRTATQAELRLMFMRASRPATVQARGIHAFGAWYWSEAIAPRLGQRLYYRYDASDLSALYVFTYPEDQFICTLRRRDRVGATTRMHKQIQHDRRAARRAAKVYLAHERQRGLVPDPLAAMAAAAQATARQHGPAPGPSLPPGGGGERRGADVIEIVRTPFRGVLEAAEAEEHRHALRARIADEEPESREPRPERARKPSRADLSDEAIEMLGRRTATGD